MENRKAIVLVSVGTSYLEVLEETYGKLAGKMAEKFPDYEIRQAFSSDRILKLMQEKKADTFYSVEEVFDQLLEEGVGEVYVQPVYMISGQENEKLREVVNGYKEKFARIRMAKPLLSMKEDYNRVLEQVLMAAELEEGEALMLIGHGTNHHNNTEYQNLEYTAYVQGHRNVFVATLEGFQKTNILMRKLQITGCEKIRLMPLLLVCAKHAVKDIAGDDNSWKSRLEAEGYAVEPKLLGLLELPAIWDQFVEHLEEIM